MNQTRKQHGMEFFRPTWGLLFAFMVGGVLTLAVVGAAALATVELGLFDTSATKPHYRLISWAAHTTFKNSTKRNAGQIPAPKTFTLAQVQAGAQEYVNDCMACHGGPGVARARWARGLTPSPPYLLDAGQRWTKPQLFWILQRGVKMSAMPAWGESRTDAQLWSLVAFLQALPKLSATDFHRMQPAATATGVAEGLSPSAGEARYIDPH